MNERRPETLLLQQYETQEKLEAAEKRLAAMTPPDNRIFVVLPAELSAEQCERMASLINVGLLNVGISQVADEGSDPHVLHYFQFAIALAMEGGEE